MLQRGDPVPHFDVHSMLGEPFSYGSIWQHRNLVLVTLPPGEPSAEHYTSQLASLVPEFNARNATCVVARETIPGVGGPGILVADQWGEVVHVEAHDDVAGFPPPRELLEWLDYVRIRCPECEGETR